MNDNILNITVRLVVAMVLGGIVGLEREYRAKDAGFRTHFLVALGSALFTLISMYGFSEGVRDTSRVAAQVVSGIGFLGAGIIVLQRNVIRGLTGGRTVGDGSHRNGMWRGTVLYGCARHCPDACRPGAAEPFHTTPGSVIGASLFLLTVQGESGGGHREYTSCGGRRGLLRDKEQAYNQR